MTAYLFFCISVWSAYSFVLRNDKYVYVTENSLLIQTITIFQYNLIK